MTLISSVARRQQSLIHRAALGIANALAVTSVKYVADAAIFDAVSQNLLKCETVIKIFVHLILNCTRGNSSAHP